MIKKSLAIVLIAFLLFPSASLAASGIMSQYYPPVESDFYQKRISFKYYNDFGVVKIRFIQWEYGGNTVELGRKEFNVKENSDIWIDHTCKGALTVQWLNAAGEITSSLQRGQTESYLGQGDCNNFVNLSNYNEEKDSYADDTFGATKPAPGTPGKDGSGGDGTTGYDDGSTPPPTDPDTDGDGTPDSQDPAPNDPNTGGKDSDGDGTPDNQDPAPNDPNVGGECSACEVLQCPEWGDYMGKIDDIAAKIPPAPNWDEVAGTFRDTIVPRIISDLDNLLGRAPTAPGAPAAPEAPSQPSDLDDRGISSPVGSEAPGLDNSTFTPDDIKGGATPIQERQDSSGGFEINDPMGALPSQEEFMNNLPAPEEGESPNPATQDLPSPAAPTELENNAPSPTEQENTAPSPAEGDNVAPTPTEGSNSAPLPGSDGSTAPIPGDNTDQAPIPDPTGETAPLPGG